MLELELWKLLLESMDASTSRMTPLSLRPTKPCVESRVRRHFAPIVPAPPAGASPANLSPNSPEDTFDAIQRLPGCAAVGGSVSGSFGADRRMAGRGRRGPRPR